MPSFATKEGFVVTPAKTPSLYAFLCPQDLQYQKNFMIHSLQFLNVDELHV